MGPGFTGNPPQKIKKKNNDPVPMKYLTKLLRGLGIENAVQTSKEGRIWSDTSMGRPNPWFDKVKLPNYPVSEKLKRRIGTQLDYNQLNGRANKYLEYQVNRMERNRSNPTLFFTIGLSLMHRSKAFRIAFINKSLKGWYQNRKLKSVLKVWFKIPTLNGRTDVKTHRF